MPDARIDNTRPLLSGTGFAEGAVYGTTVPASYRGPLHFFGSWLGSDQSVGSAKSSWYQVNPNLYIFVAGYPRQPGNQLFLQVATTDSAVVHLPLALPDDPGEIWTRETLPLSKIKNAVRFRIVAIDGSTRPAGWLGFSEPFSVKSEDQVALFEQLLLLTLATASAVLFFLFPGLALRQFLLRHGKPISFVWVPVPGVIGLALLGLAAWAGPQAVSGKAIVDSVLAVLAISAILHFGRIPIPGYTSVVERRVLLAVIMLMVLGIAKSTYSLGTTGELYRGAISRTLEVGARSDSRISYHVVQLVGTRSRPYSNFAASLFAPYNFSDRGPLAALAAAPMVLAGPVSVPATMPSQPWAVFDPEGFAAYRVGMIAIACGSLIFVFGLVTVFLSAEWSFFAFLVTSSAPFVIHEIYFTWPKLEAGAFAVLGAYLVFRSKYFAAGFAVGLGYLFHPSALLALPALLALVVLSSGQFHFRFLIRKRYLLTWAARYISLILGVATWLLVWRRINRKHFTQGGFFSYFFQTDRQAPTIVNWLQSRYDSLTNTIVPFNVIIFHRSDWGLNSIYGPSPLLIQFFMQYALSLPFAAGIVFLLCLVYLIYLAWRQKRAWLVWIVIVPLLCFVIYFGASRTGLLREGLHAWFLGLMVFLMIVWRKFAAGSRRFWTLAKWCLMLRGVEVLVMLLLPSIWSEGKLIQHQFAVSDTLSIVVMIGATVWLYREVLYTAERLRLQEHL